MKIEHPKGTESSVSKNTKSNKRRTFLKRASATAVVGAIPAKSVWATGITNSIVASGHGSDRPDLSGTAGVRRGRQLVWSRLFRGGCREI